MFVPASVTDSMVSAVQLFIASTAETLGRKYALIGYLPHSRTDSTQHQSLYSSVVRAHAYTTLGKVRLVANVLWH